MKPPINTKSYSYVEFPTAVFSLERHEIYPYDRFAYNVLRIGAEALNSRNLPDRMRVSFSQGADGSHWWAFNAGIRPMPELFGPGVLGFEVSTTPVAPLMLFGMSHYAATSLLHPSEDYDRRKTVMDLRAFLRDFASHFTQALASYRKEGLASCIRTLYELGGIRIWDLNQCHSTYDLLVQFIANHEIAHAYTGQLTKHSGVHSPADKRAFELIVDILATQWIYNQMIVNTPDTDAYRKFRGTSSHEESLFQNALLVLEGQVMTLLLFGFAAALANKGKVVLDGGVTHPHALVRCMFQHVHFMTLLQSNCAGKLAEAQFQQFNQHYGFFMSVLAEVGFFNRDDAKALTDSQTVDDFRRAYELVEQYDIQELKKSREIFQIAASARDKVLSGKTVSFL